MKNLIASIILNIIASGVFACGGYGISSLTIKAPHHSNLTVILDNNRYHSTSNLLQIDNLPAGDHHLRIVANKGGGNYWSSEEIYNGHFKTNAGTKVVAKVNSYGHLEMRQMAQNHNNQCEPKCHSSSYAPQMMSPQSFANLRSTIDNTTFDDNKLRVAQHAITSNSMSSRQVEELVEMMSFESTKLKLAKFAYGKVVDPENYFVVNDAFDFNSSSQELMAYIGY